jgi:hypothetical protein
MSDHSFHMLGTCDFVKFVKGRPLDHFLSGGKLEYCKRTMQPHTTTNLKRTMQPHTTTNLSLTVEFELAKDVY